jgi:hypothetical protein
MKIPTHAVLPSTILTESTGPLVISKESLIWAKIPVKRDSLSHEEVKRRSRSKEEISEEISEFILLFISREKE